MRKVLVLVTATGLAALTCAPALAAPIEPKQLLNERYAKCLDAANDGGSNARRPAILWDCHDGANQKWTFNIDGTISSGAYPDMCLDVPGESGGVNGTQVMMWDCHADPNQRWTRVADGTIESVAHPGKCLDAAADHQGANGSAVVVWDCHAQGNQRWIELDAVR